MYIRTAWVPIGRKHNSLNQTTNFHVITLVGTVVFLWVRNVLILRVWDHRFICVHLQWPRATQLLIDRIQPTNQVHSNNTTKPNPPKTIIFQPNPIQSMDGTNPRLYRLETQRTNWLTDHDEPVAVPETTRATRTHRHVASLNGDHVCRDFAEGAAADERRHFDAGTGHRHHWQRGGRRQPEPFFVMTGVVADVVEVAEHEPHRAEPLQTRLGRPYTRTCNSGSSFRAVWS